MISAKSCRALLHMAAAIMTLKLVTDVGATSGEQRGTWVRPRTDTACSYDRMRVSWNINVEEITRITPEWEPPLQFSIYRTQDEGVSSDNPAPVRNLLTSFDVVSEAGGQGLVPRALASSRPMPGSEACSFINPITCFLNGPTCVPSVVSIKLDGPERRATLNFDQPTNQAAIPDMEAFLNFFHVDVAVTKAIKEAEKQTASPPLSGEAGSAAGGVADGPGFSSTWVDGGRTLLATFPDHAFVALYSVGAAGQLSLQLRPPECKGQVFGGHLHLRLSEPGHYTVDLSYAAANGSRVSWGPIFEASWAVHACDDYVVHISRPSKPETGGGELRPQVTSRVPAPVLSSSAVMGFNSQRPLKVAHATLPNQEVGSWSMGFWAMLLDGPTGHHRTLFYKGDGHTARTPSAWLLPDSNRLTLRASVEGSADLGSDSVGELAVGAWTHVLLTFSNDTAALEEAAQGEEGVRYAMSLFLDGRHDVTVKYRLPAFANDGMLSIGKDPSNAGPRMLLSQFKLWDRALLRSQAAMEYDTTLHHFYPPQGEGLGSRAVEAINVVMASGLGPFRQAGQGHLQLPQPGGEEVLVDVAQVMFEGGEEARASCSGLAERVSLFESAGGKGHARAAYQAANLRLHGEEDLSYDYRPSKDCRPGVDELKQLRSTSLALQDLAHASSHGHAGAARLLALSLLGGVGVWGASTRRFLHTLVSPGPHAPLPGMVPVADLLWAAPRSGAHPEFKRDVGNAALRPSILLAPRRQAEKTGEAASGQGNVTDVSGLALGLFHLAAVLDDAQAQRALAVRYHNGWGVEKDLIAAGYYYEAAADVAASHFHAAGQEPFHEMQRLSDATVEKVEVGQRGEDDEDLRYTIMRAEEGNVPAMITVGDMLYWGARGMPRDHGRALRYFERAAVAGDRGAMCLAAGMYLKGEGVAMNHTRAVELYNEAADGGSVRALNGLGYAYFVGDAVEKNLTKAFSYFERAALIGSDGDSLFNAAHCLEHGHGTEQDLARAAGLYQQAAERFGHFDSAHVLGKLYMDGRVVGQNFMLAIRYLEPASRMGHWGRLVRGGFDRYLARDYLGAYILYGQAAELGYDVAQHNAAYLLDKGLVDIRALVGGPSGGPVNRPAVSGPAGELGARNVGLEELCAKLLGWAREALSLRLHWLAYARGGVAEAAVAIGDAYFFGRGGLIRDHTQASYWYSRAGAAGATQGSLSLGYMYEMGLGVGESDWDRAEKHYRQALQADKTDANWVVCSLALARLSIWRRLDRFTLGHRLWQRLREHTATGFMEGLRSRAAREAEPRDVVTRVMTVMRLVMQNATQALQWMDADTVLILVLAMMLAFVLRLRAMRKRGAARRCEARRGTEEGTTHTEPVQEDSQ